MLLKFFKYGLMIQAELLSMAAEEIQKKADEFVKKNTDDDYEKYLSKMFEDMERQLKHVSPPLDQLLQTVETLKSNFLSATKKS